MNFSTVPPWRSSSARRRAWYGESTRADVLRVELLRLRGEADEVDEDDRDGLPLLAERALLGLERPRARVAEPGAVRVLLSTTGASTGT